MSGLLHACVLVLACSSALAIEDVSMTLLHDLGDGFVPAGTIIGNLPGKVRFPALGQAFRESQALLGLSNRMHAIYGLFLSL